MSAFEYASTEYGAVTHRVAAGVTFGGAASAACGTFSRLWVPPEQPPRLCPRCFPSSTRERER